MIRYVIIIFAAAIISCESFPENHFECFVIPENEHYATNRHAEALQSSTLFFQARFDETAEYSLPDGLQDSKNKLLGFSDCNAEHHENSARFGWQWFNNTIEIFAYCYVDGRRIEAYLGEVSIGEVADYEIEITSDAYVFTFQNKKTRIERKSQCETGVYMMLWPFFGGQHPAPHDVNVYLKRF